MILPDDVRDLRNVGVRLKQVMSAGAASIPLLIGPSSPFNKMGFIYETYKIWLN